MSDPAVDPRSPSSPRWLQRPVKWLRLPRWSLLAVPAAAALAGLAAHLALAFSPTAASRVPASFSFDVALIALVLAGVLWLAAVLLTLRRGAPAAQAATRFHELSGALSRPQFMQLAEREWSRSRRYDSDCAVLLVDPDHLGRINDEHGSRCGDALLERITRVSGGLLRRPDVLARYDGGAVVVLLPHTDPIGALDVAERIRTEVLAQRLEWHGVAISATVSVGVAAIGSGHASLDALLREAEQALDAAKAAGRNCVRAAPIRPRRSGEARPVISK